MQRQQEELNELKFKAATPRIYLMVYYMGRTTWRYNFGYHALIIMNT
jgi:hypothetical protein